jgi:hypothetical protein
VRDLKAVRSGKLFHQPFLARFSSVHGLWRGRMARSRVAIEVTGAPIKLFKEFKEEFL